MDELNRETLKTLIARNLIRLARKQHNCPDAKADCKIEPSQWGTDMNSIGQVFNFHIVLHKDNETVGIIGHACLTEWPGTDKCPQVTGRAAEQGFEFFL